MKKVLTLFALLVCFCVNARCITISISPLSDTAVTCIPVYITLSTAICANSTYNFNGIELTTSGNYTDTLTASSGCDSIVTLNLLVNPLPAVIGVNSRSVCPGDTTAGIDFSAGGGGTYSWTSSNTSIGLASSGTGYIAPFTVTNTGSLALVDTITVTHTGYAGYAYITQFQSGSVTVINTATDSIARIINVGNNPAGAVVTPDGTKAYIANFGSNSVSVIGAATAVIDTIALGNSPYGIAISPAGDKAYTANTTGSVSVINTLADTLIKNIAVSAQSFSIELNPVLHKAYVVSALDSFAVISTDADTVLKNGQSPFSFTGGIAFSPDGSKAYLTASPNMIVVINAVTDSIIDTLSSPYFSGYGDVAVSPDGATLYVISTDLNVLAISDTLGNVYDTISVGNFPESVGLSPDGELAYVPSYYDSSVWVINTATRRLIAVIPVAPYPESFGHYISAGACTGTPATFTITVNPVVKDSFAVTLPHGSLYDFGGANISTSGIYRDTLTAVTGCDSIAVLNLTILDTGTCVPVYATLNDTICQGDSALLHGIWYASAGNYLDTLVSSEGCDSIVTLMLRFRFPQVITVVQDSADGVTCYPSDNNFYCYPVARLIPHFYGTVDSFYWTINDTNIFNVDTLALKVAQDTATGFNVILQPNVNYTYCINTYSRCSDVSFCGSLQFIPTGINAVDLANSISIYPNPATQMLYIKTENINPQSIIMYDVEGQMVSTQKFTAELDVSHLTAGVYLLEIKATEGTARKRWVKM